ncbi:BglG family transcription antiterminator LicT [Anaerosinus massiliensis]|uniref:BglG family transcription antiterminator LicT n=1 Tax=Massilibacillus massiliensis TaxID=1806837 RepID=UPI000AAC01C1|nr:PRD domain-containing protein [Massilibacillus massiliensis]
MIIKKILNNNVIITENEKAQEIVAMGRGIAFKKRCGDDVPSTAIDKIYTLSNQEIFRRFEQLVQNLSLEYMEISSEIIEMAEKKLQKKLNDCVYISLTDHLHMAVTRFREGAVVKNMMDWEIKRFYRDEYAIGEKALGMLNQKFGLELPVDEIGFIALHIVDAQIDSDIPMADHITKLIQEITNIVRHTCAVEFDVESLQYYRFITHLKFFAKRMFTEKEIVAEVDEEIEKLFQKKYVAAYRCVQKIDTFIQMKYKYQVSADEKFYLMIHIAKVIRTN